MYSKSPKVEFTFEWSHNQPITTYFISATHPYLDTLAIKSWLTANRPDYSPLSHSAKLCWRNWPSNTTMPFGNQYLIEAEDLKAEVRNSYCWLFYIFLPPRQSVRGPLTGASAVTRLLHLLSDHHMHSVTEPFNVMKCLRRACNCVRINSTLIICFLSLLTRCTVIPLYVKVKSQVNGLTTRDSWFKVSILFQCIGK